MLARRLALGSFAILALLGTSAIGRIKIVSLVSALGMLEGKSIADSGAGAGIEVYRISRAGRSALLCHRSNGLLIENVSMTHCGSNYVAAVKALLRLGFGSRRTGGMYENGIVSAAYALVSVTLCGNVAPYGGVIAVKRYCNGTALGIRAVVALAYLKSFGSAGRILRNNVVTHIVRTLRSHVNHRMSLGSANIADCGLGTVGRTCRIVIENVFPKNVNELRTLVGHSIGNSADLAASRLGAVLCTGGVLIGEVSRIRVSGKSAVILLSVGMIAP